MLHAAQQWLESVFATAMAPVAAPSYPAILKAIFQVYISWVILPGPGH